jgi:hypothetical protein
MADMEDFAPALEEDILDEPEDLTNVHAIQNK